MATSELTAGSKLGWLIAGRLVTALLLSVVGTLWTTGGDTSQSINKSLGLLTIVAVLTILYALIFRLSKDIPQHADDILEKRPKSVWFQLGIVNDEAAEKLAAAGIKVVQDKCLMVEHRYLRR